MIVLHHPTFRSIIGMDSHSGWLPRGAATPLPAPPQPALMDLRVLHQGADYVLAWCTHDPSHWTLPSGQGQCRSSDITSALSEAELRFGMAPTTWPFDFRGGPPDAASIDRIVTGVLDAHDILEADAHGWGSRVTPPKQAVINITGAAPELLWIVMSGAGYDVFYDPETGGFGLASSGAQPTYIGDYGPLWATLISM